MCAAAGLLESSTEMVKTLHSKLCMDSLEQAAGHNKKKNVCTNFSCNSNSCTVSACILWCFAILGISADDRGYISSEPPKEFYVPVCGGQGMHCNTVVC